MGNEMPPNNELPESSTQEPTEHLKTKEALASDYFHVVGRSFDFSQEMLAEADAFFGTAQGQEYLKVKQEAEAQMTPDAFIRFDALLLEKVIKGEVPEYEMEHLKDVFRTGIRDAVVERNKQIDPNKHEERLASMSKAEQDFWLAGRQASASI